MDQVVAPDGGAVPVAHGHQHVQVRIPQSHTGGSGQSPAVGHVHAVDVQIVIHPAEAADAADQSHVVLVHFQFRHDGSNGLEHDSVAAPGAPGLRQFVKQHIVLVRFHYFSLSS